MNSIMERSIGGCRREMLDRTLIWNQRHLMSLPREYENFYNTIGRTEPPTRPHRSVPCPTASPNWVSSGSSGATAPEA